MVDYAELAAANTEAMLDAEAKARTVARDLDTYAEVVVKQRRILPKFWRDQGGAKAEAELSTHARDLEQAQIAYGAVSRAMGALAGEITAAKKILDEAQEIAAKRHAVIRADGGVDVYPPKGADKGYAERVRSAVKAKIKEALDKADAADRAAVQALGAVRTPDAPNVTQAQIDNTKPPANATPEQIAAWWRSLPPDLREAIKNEHPELVGGLDGVPAADRNDANRLKLDNDQDALREKLKDPNLSPEDREKLNRQLKGLDDLERKLDEIDADADKAGTPDAKTLLLKVDPTGDGRAIVAVGDPDKADNVLTYVPGAKNDLDTLSYAKDENGSPLDRTVNMQQQATAADPNAKTSAITWLDLDTPSTDVETLTSGTKHGYPAQDLADFQNGLRATHEGPPSRNTLLGHSYGGPVSGNAADHYDLKVDNLVHAGSVGSGQGVGGDAGDLRGRPHVWSTVGGKDNFAAPLYGTSPNSDGYGATRFDSGAAEHSGYWRSKEFNDNLARIVTGQYDKVTPDHRAGLPVFDYSGNGDGPVPGL